MPVSTDRDRAGTSDKAEAPTTPWALTDSFADRHIGPRPDEIRGMLETLGLTSLEELIDRTLPEGIRQSEDAGARFPAVSEHDLLEQFRELAGKNQVFRSFLGMGYHDTIVPPVIQRNILENPGWYTQYTPYQSEIAQGRLEALLNYQTLIGDLTGLPIANSSLLDEATAAAEAMTMCFGIKARRGAKRFLVSERCHPATIDVVKTRALPLGIEVTVGNHEEFEFQNGDFAVLLQYPATEGEVIDYEPIARRAQEAQTMVIVAADLLSLVVLRPPSEFGADVCVGNSQRLGVPLGFGGPHAAFLSTSEAYKRQIPGRIVGVSKDRRGREAYRLALQTREQHIRREKATSNICTAQVLLAVMASLYAVYHGPEGLRRIANRIHRVTRDLARALRELGFENRNSNFFDTLRFEIEPSERARLLERARTRGFNFRVLGESEVVLALDETTKAAELRGILEVFSGKEFSDQKLEALEESGGEELGYAPKLARTDEILSHPVFHRYHSETEFLRYVHRLQSRDLSLTTSMIPLGSCTMKLNATSEMLPVTWPEFSRIHPFVPSEQTAGYRELFDRLSGLLADLTGFAAVSLQPNAGSQGEYAGLLVIREYHRSRGEGHRNHCLIPESAHGTNPASATMAGMKVVVVKCDDEGNIDLADLSEKAARSAENLAALMVTYPSTHGVFEESIQDVCQTIHDHGGQVYLDGANLNAQVGLCRPGDYGADVCHLNLHKTFCIPHGGGGPGMGPIGVAKHLAPFLPGHPLIPTGGEKAIGAIAGAPWGSASILPISYLYMALLGSEGLAQATRIAILNANYMARRLGSAYPILYSGEHGLVAHEFILDLRALTKTSGVTVEDVAKRLMDYGYHAPTVSFPVPGTLMIEPTESESKAELDRFCEAMLSIRKEIQELESGQADREDNVLKNAPHTAQDLVEEPWEHPYSREKAFFPAPWTRDHKFWPAVNRIDNVYGDRNLVCACVPISDYADNDANPEGA